MTADEGTAVACLLLVGFVPLVLWTGYMLDLLMRGGQRKVDR